MVGVKERNTWGRRKREEGGADFCERRV